MKKSTWNFSLCQRYWIQKSRPWKLDQNIIFDQKRDPAFPIILAACTTRKVYNLLLLFFHSYFAFYSEPWTINTTTFLTGQCSNKKLLQPPHPPLWHRLVLANMRPNILITATIRCRIKKNPVRNRRVTSFLLPGAHCNCSYSRFIFLRYVCRPVDLR